MKFELLNFGYCIVIKSYVALFVLSVFYHITLTCNICTTFAKNKIKFFELTLSGYTYCKAQCQGRTVLSVLLRFTVSDYLFVRYLQALPTTHNQIHWLLQPEYFMNTMALTTRCHCMSYRTAYLLFLRLYYSHYLFQQRSNNTFFLFLAYIM